MTHVNWIQERAFCYLPNVFKALQKVVAQDVTAANRYSPLAEQRYEFTFHEENERQFKVVRRHGPVEPAPSVTFTLNHHTIHVAYDGHSFYVTPQWHDDDHRCELRIDGKQSSVELWQISREALNHLVFPPPN